MTRSNVLAIVSFAVVFAAGFFVGQLGWGDSGNSNRDGFVGSLSAQLKLTPDQQEKVRAIWSEQLTETSPSAVEGRWRLAEEARDKAVRMLLTPQQLPEYDKIVERHKQIAEAFKKDLARKQRDAQEQTRSLLTPPQRERFDKLIEKREKIGDAAVPAGVPVSDIAPATKPRDRTAQ